MTNKTERNHKILVELDCLLDTRLGTLALIDENLLIKALGDGYVVREEENFPPLSKKLFIELYDSRDKEVLKISPLTSCPEFIKELSFNVLRQATESPVASGVEIIVNTYPYILTDSEAKDLLTSLAIFTNKFINLKLIHASYEELTPAVCKASFDSMFLYQYDKWLDVHTVLGNFKNVNVSKLMLYGPKIFFNRKPTFEEKRKFEKEKISIFGSIEEIVSATIDLTLLDISIFSVDISKYVTVDKTA